MNFYRPEFFDVRELVDPVTLSRLGPRALMVFRPEALRMLDDLRRFVGVPITINNWHLGGTFQFSGFRPYTTTVGAAYSAHRLGCGFDLKFRGKTVQQVYADILSAHKEGNPMVQRIRRMENVRATPTWLHVDTYEHESDKILIVMP